MPEGVSFTSESGDFLADVRSPVPEPASRIPPLSAFSGGSGETVCSGPWLTTASRGVACSADIRKHRRPNGCDGWASPAVVENVGKDRLGSENEGCRFADRCPCGLAASGCHGSSPCILLAGSRPGLDNMGFEGRSRSSSTGGNFGGNWRLLTVRYRQVSLCSADGSIPFTRSRRNGAVRPRPLSWARGHPQRVTGNPRSWDRKACSPFAVKLITRESLARDAQPSSCTRLSNAVPSAPPR